MYFSFVLTFKQLMLTSALLLAFAFTLKAETIYVDQANATAIEEGTALAPYKTIGDAVAAALAGDTVRVAPGNYLESVTIDKEGLILKGDNPTKTVIQSASDIFIIKANRAEISGFTIKSSSSAGIRVQGEFSRINNNVFGYNQNAIVVNESTTINNNSFIENKTAVSQDAWQKSSSVSCNIFYNNNNAIYIGYNGGTISSSYNNLWQNGTDYNTAAISRSNDITMDPMFSDSFTLLGGSPSIDAGSPFPADRDPDGSRNDQGAFGGPGAAEFWPGTASGPVVTELLVTPPSVPQGGTISIQATGRIR